MKIGGQRRQWPGFISKKLNENKDIKEKKKTGSPFGLACIANPANFNQNWAGLAVLSEAEWI